MKDLISKKQLLLDFNSFMLKKHEEDCEVIELIEPCIDEFLSQLQEEAKEKSADIKLNPLIGYYIIGNIKGGTQTETIDYQRKGTIAKFLNGTNMTWEECEKVGWRCFKVDIIFK